MAMLDCCATRADNDTRFSFHSAAWQGVRRLNQRRLHGRDCFETPFVTYSIVLPVGRRARPVTLRSCNGALGSPGSRLVLLIAVSLLAGCEQSSRGPGGQKGHGPPPSKHVTHAAFSSDNKLLLTVYAFQGVPGWDLEPSALDLWNVTTGAHVSLQSIQEGGVGQVAFLPNSTLALSAGRELTLWDVQQRKVVQKLEYGGGFLGVSSDGKLAVCGGPTKDLQVWDLTKRKVLRTFSFGRPSGTSTLTALSVSPDGSLACLELAPLQGELTALELRSTLDGKLVLSFPSSERWSRPMAFSSDGKRLVLRKEGALVLLDVPSGRQTCRFAAEATAVAFSSDGKRVVAFCEPTASPTLSSWDTATARQLWSQRMGWWDLFVFSRDGRFGVAAQGDESPSARRLGGTRPLSTCPLACGTPRTASC